MSTTTQLPVATAANCRYVRECLSSATTEAAPRHWLVSAMRTLRALRLAYPQEYRHAEALATVESALACESLEDLREYAFAALLTLEW